MGGTSSKVGNILVGGVFLSLITVGIFGGLFVDENIAIRTFEADGFTNVRVVNRQWFMPSLGGCGDSDRVRFEVVATNPSGKEQTGIVCSGWPFKGATRRTT